MTKIQRYEPWPQEWPKEDPKGDLVLYEDHRKIVAELKSQLKTVLDRETSILRYYDKKLDAAEENQLQKALALPQIAVLVEALCKSAEGWDNVMGMGLIAKKHFGSAKVLRDEAFDALQRVGVEL